MSFDPLYADKGHGYFANYRHELLKFIHANVYKVLDIGCGIGNFGELLKSYKNYEVWGVEPEVKSTLEAAKKLDRVVIGEFTATAQEFSGQTF